MNRLFFVVVVTAGLIILTADLRSQTKNPDGPMPKEDPATGERRLGGDIITHLGLTAFHFGGAVPGLECIAVLGKNLKAEAALTNAALEDISKLVDYPDEVLKKLQSDNPDDRFEAVEFVANFARLVRMVAWAKDDYGDDVLLVAFGKYAQPIRRSLETLLPKANDKERGYVASVLLMLDPAHAGAIGAFTKELRAEDKARRAAICKMSDVVAHPQFIPLLAEIVKVEKDFDVRRAAAHALSRIGPKAASAVPALIEFLKCGDKAYELAPNVFSFESKWLLENVALRALSEMGPSARQAVPIIKDMLDKAPPQDCQELIECLACIGPPAKEAVPAIRRRLKADNVEIRQFAAAALLRLEPGDADAMNILEEALRKGSKETKYSAMKGIERLGPKAEALVPLLIAALKDEQCSQQAAMALGGMGEIAEEAIPALVEVFKNGDKAAALFGLRGIGKASLPPLVKLLDNPKFYFCEGIALVLGDFGKESTVAVPALVRMLEQKVDWALLAPEVLGDRWQTADPPARVVLLEELQQYNESVAFFAATALGRLRRTAAPARAALLQAVETRNNYIAAWALTQLDRDDVPRARQESP